MEKEKLCDKCGGLMIVRPGYWNSYCQSCKDNIVEARREFFGELDARIEAERRMQMNFVEMEVFS